MTSYVFRSVGTNNCSTPRSDSTTHLVLSPLELIEKLAALVPSPRLNLVRYHGILAPNTAGRRLVAVLSDPASVRPLFERGRLSGRSSRDRSGSTSPAG